MKRIYLLITVFFLLFIGGCHNIESNQVHQVKYMVNNNLYYTHSITNSDKVSKMPTPILEGHTFCSWLLNDKPVYSLENINQSITLVASFKKNNYSVVIYNYKGMSVNKNYQYGDYITNDESFQQDKYELTGYYDYYTGENYSLNSKVTKNLVLLCRYNPLTKNTITVTYQINSFPEFTILLNKGDNLPSFSHLNNDLEYTYINDTQVKNVNDLKVESNIVISTMPSCFITFHYNNKTRTNSIPIGKTINGFTPSLGNNYEFLYWTDKYGRKFDFDTPIYENIDLYTYSKYINIPHEFDYKIENDEIEITKCLNSFESKIVIPSVIEDKPVCKIAPSCFENNNNIVSIMMPDSIKTIGKRAFYNASKLRSITLSSNIEELPEECFKYCESLTSISIFPKTKKIGKWAFYGCKKLTNVYLTNGLEIIGNASFTYTNIKTITIPQSVQKIGDFAFANCYYLTDIFLNEGLKNIGHWAFFKCGIETLSLPRSVEKIGGNICFSCNNLINISLYSSTFLDKKTFNNISKIQLITIYKVSEINFPKDWNWDFKLNKKINYRIY